MIRVMFLLMIAITLIITSISPLFSTEKSQVEKYYHILTIADKIWSTVAVPYEKPGIILTDMAIDMRNLRSLACYHPGKDSIIINLRFYDFCMTEGEAELAVIIGHEIGHYFNNHLQSYSVNGYILSENDIDFVKNKLKKDNLDVCKGHETQADLFSAFHCLSAGYNIRTAMPNILEKIYGIDSSVKISENYLALNERQQIAINAFNSVKSMIPLFTAAVKLSVIGEYILAARCFDYIANFGQFTSWEIYHNAGVCYALEALQFKSDKEKAFIYPFELKSNSEIMKYEERSAARGLTNSIENKEIYRRSMILEARDRFRTVIEMNGRTTFSYINLACLYELMGNYDDARNHAIRAEKLSKNQNSLNQAHIIKGIIFSHRDTKAAAIEFNSAVNSLIAEYNLCVLLNCNTDSLETTSYEIPPPLGTPNECINGINLLNFETEIENLNYSTRNYVISNNSQQINLKLNYYYDDYYEWMKIETGNGSLFIIEAKNSYTGKTARGLTIMESKKDDITKTYGTPTRIIQSNNGEYLIYEELKNIFLLNGQKIKSWMLYE